MQHAVKDYMQGTEENIISIQIYDIIVLANSLAETEPVVDPY